MHCKVALCQPHFVKRFELRGLPNRRPVCTELLENLRTGRKTKDFVSRKAMQGLATPTDISPQSMIRMKNT